MWLAVFSRKVSAQSPPMRTKARPRLTAAIWARRESTSPAKTSGGRLRRSAVTAASSAASG